MYHDEIDITEVRPYDGPTVETPRSAGMVMRYIALHAHQPMATRGEDYHLEPAHGIQVEMTPFSEMVDRPVSCFEFGHSIKELPDD